MKRPSNAAPAPLDPYELLGRLTADAAQAPGATRRRGDLLGDVIARAAAVRPAADADERAAILSAVGAMLHNGPSGGVELDKAIDLLRLYHLKQTDPEGERREGELYDAARRHFHRGETALREQARLTDRILDRIQSGNARRTAPAHAFQLEIGLRAQPRAVAAGRFLLASDLPRAAVVGFRPGVLRGRTLPWSDEARVRFDPPSPVLHDGQEIVVRAEIDLADCPAATGDILSLDVDVQGDGETMLKIWFEITIDAIDGSER